MRITGKVKFYNREKNWGFITRDDGAGDVFVHLVQLEETGLTYLLPGTPVEFEIEQSKKGTRAVAVRAL